MMPIVSGQMATENEQVTLSGQNHLKYLCDGLWKFFSENYMVDITVACHGHSVKAHRLILAIFSPILRESLLASSEKQLIEDHALNLDYVTNEGSYVQYLIEFLYQGRVTLPRACLDSLLNAAEVLSVHELVNAIQQYRLNDKTMTKNEPPSKADGGHSPAFADSQEHIPGMDTDNGTAGSNSSPSKRKRKRKPMKVTKVFDDEDVCMASSIETKECSDASEGKPLRTLRAAAPVDTPRVTRSAALRAQEAQMACTSANRKVPLSTKSNASGPKVDAKVANDSSTDQSDIDYDEIPLILDDDDVEGLNTDGKDAQLWKLEMESEEYMIDEEEQDSEVEKKAARCVKRESRKGRRRQLSRRGGRRVKEVKVGGEKQSLTKEYRKLWRQNRPVLKCPDCDYETRDKGSYNSHIARHDPTTCFVCDICSKKLRSKKGFRCHRLSHSGPERLHKCTHCPFHTPQKWNWLQHLAVIHKVDPSGNPLTENIKCEQCDFVCVANHQLKAHMLRKHTVDKPFKCQQCDYSTVIKHELEKHIGIRHQNERRYMCEACGFRSQTQGGLTRHKRSHTGVKPFKCEICGMCYADRGKLKIHVQRHVNDEKPFVCHLCGHACRRRDNLRMHLKRIHGTNLESEGCNSRMHNVLLPDVQQRQQQEHIVVHSEEQLHHLQQLQGLTSQQDPAQQPSLGHSQASAMETLQQQQQPPPNPHSQMSSARPMQQTSHHAQMPNVEPLQASQEPLSAIHNESCLAAVARDDNCSLLQAVTGALDCANNATNHLHVIQEVQCVVIQSQNSSV